MSSDAYPRLIDALDDLRRRWRARQVLDGILRAWCLAAAGLVVAVAADNLIGFGRPGRAALALALWGMVVAGVLSLVVRRLLEDRRDDFFAALVERAFPDLKNRLINALQLGRGNQPGVSPRLVEAIVQDAAHATSDLEFERGLDRRPLRRSSYYATGALAVLIGYGVIFPPRLANGMARVLMPWADIPPYTATRIDPDSVKPGDARVPEGAKVVVEAKVRGAVPASARLERATGRDAAQTLSMSATKEGGFQVTLPQVGESFDYAIAAGDGRSRRYRVEVVKRPRLAGLSLTYTPPSYVAQAARRVAESDGEIAGLLGTAVQVELKATKPLREAAFVAESGELVALEHAGDASTWRGAFTLWGREAKAAPPLSTGRLLNAPARYRVKLIDTDGYENADPLWHAIALVKDQPPSVAVTAPGRDLQVAPGSTVPLAVESGDDYGLGDVRVVYRVNDDPAVRDLTRFDHNAGKPELRAVDQFAWNLGSASLKGGDLVQYWAVATDRDALGGPNRAESRRFSIFVVTPEQTAARLDVQVSDYAQVLEELARLQRENRAQTAAGASADGLVAREARIREGTTRLARAMEKDALPVRTMVRALDDLAAGLMADALKTLEAARDAATPERSKAARDEALPIQDKIVAELEALLARLQRNEQAKKELRKLAKADQPAHKQVTDALGAMVKDLDRLLKDQTELAGKFEKLPKKDADELNEESLKEAGKDLEEFQKKWNAWAKGKVNELTKLPTGFVDDFDLRPDVNKIFEEIEKAAQRPKSSPIEVPLEDLGAGLATKMKEDLEMWMPDAPDAAKWVLEEPLNQKPMKIPEMSLPKALEDMIGDLLQTAEEFDEEADDITSAWGDNLDQAGWGVSDGPISSFSAKGKTGNDLPNNHEVSGRSGDGRRGKSSGQMVGDTARALGGRKTPARVGAEKYEPGQLKQEGQDDPNGATGGGKKAGAGRMGLQGGTPPDFVKDIGRLGEHQAGLREKAEQVARKLDAVGLSSRKVDEGITLMKSAEADLRDLRYGDAARKRRIALNALRSGLTNLDGSTAAQVSRARDLPPQLRSELLQSADEGYPAGYESMLKSYYKALSETEK